jgi:hypothetical protein
MTTQPDPRRGEPGATYVHAHDDGSEHKIHADDDGVVQPTNEDEERLADLFDLPIARKVEAAKPAAKEE